MKKILLISENYENWKKHSPSNSLILNNCEFFLDNDFTKNREYDFYIFCGLVDKTSFINKKNSALILQEPPSIYEYSKSYTSQFEYLFYFNPTHKHNKQIYFCPSFWQVGNLIKRKSIPAIVEEFLSYTDLYNLKNEKKNLLSVILSDKVSSKEYEIRFKMIQSIVSEFKNEIDTFGAGFGKEYLENKLIALDSYYYHICIENYFANDFWTEKLSDPLIARSNPIYYGCQNLEKYFEDRFYLLKPEDENYNLKIIEKILKKKSNKFEFEHSRELIFSKYSIMNFISNFVNKNYSKEKKIEKIYSYKNFINTKMIWKKISKVFRF
jgi:hypothetical protein